MTTTAFLDFKTQTQEDSTNTSTLRFREDIQFTYKTPHTSANHTCFLAQACSNTLTTLKLSDNLTQLGVVTHYIFSKYSLRLS